MSSIDHALARLHKIGGDSLVRKMVAAFLENASRRIDGARRAVAASDAAALGAAAHSLKSSAGNVGADELARQAAELEQRAATAGPEELAPRVDRLAQTFREVETRLRREEAG